MIYLDAQLQTLDLFEILGIGAVGVVQGALQFPDVRLVLLLEARDLGLVAGLHLYQRALQLLDDAGTALPARRTNRGKEGKFIVFDECSFDVIRHVKNNEQVIQ